MNLDFYAARVMAARGGWSVISCDREPAFLQTLESAGPKVIPAYFQDVASRKFQYDTDRGCQTLNLLEDLAGWFDRCGGDKAAVNRATTVLKADGQFPPWRHFLSLVNAMYRAGALKYLSTWESRPERQMPATVDFPDNGPAPESTWVPQQITSQWIAAQSGVYLDIPSITRSLEDEGVLVSELEFLKQIGWVVPSEWWWREVKVR